MPLLAFDVPDLEQDFASFFGWECRRPTFLLSLVMCLVWTSRLIRAEGKTDLWFISIWFPVMISFHLFNSIAIYKDPSVCCAERRKANFLILDAICCMVTVLVYSGRPAGWQSSIIPTKLTVSTPFMVYALHGWGVPFGGFRLSTDIYLHLLNIQVYLLTKVQIPGTWPSFSTAFSAFCLCTLVPITVNVVFEANVRVAYLARRGLPPKHLSKFWQKILEWGLKDKVQV